MDKNIKELVRLSEENPDLPVKFAVGYEVLGDDSCYWWNCDISKITVEYFYVDEEIWVAGYDDIEEHFEIKYEDNYKEKFKEALAEKTIVKAIIVYLDI